MEKKTGIKTYNEFLNEGHIPPIKKFGDRILYSDIKKECDGEYDAMIKYLNELYIGKNIILSSQGAFFENEPKVYFLDKYYMDNYLYMDGNNNGIYENLESVGKPLTERDVENLKKGDALICIKPNGGNFLKRGNIYFFIHSTEDKDFISIENRQGGRMSGFFPNRFTHADPELIKRMNDQISKSKEKHAEIDPYGEENWDEFF